MRLFLHPGLHKTGTTSFQRLLDKNQEHFPPGLEAYNHLSPEFKRLSADIIGYHKKPTPEKLKAVSDQLIAFRDGCLDRRCETLILSNENILGLMPRYDYQPQVYMHGEAMLDTFLDVFGAGATTVFITTRNYDHWIDSVYRHQIKARGIRISLDTFAALPKFQKMRSMESLVDDIRRQLGHDVSMVTSALESSSDKPGPHTNLLLEIDPTGELFEAWQPVRRHNVGLGAAEMSKLKSPLISLAPNFLLRRYARHLLRKRRSSDDM